MAGKKIAKRLFENEQATPQVFPWNEYQLAQYIKVDPKTVYQWVKEGTRPRGDLGARAADVLGLDFVWLMDDKRPWPPPEKGDPLRGLTDEQAKIVRTALGDVRYRTAAVEMLASLLRVGR